MSSRLLSALREIRATTIEDPAALERRLLEIVASATRDADDATTLEILGGEVTLRLDHARAEREARRAHRQIDLLRALSHAGQEALRLPEVADRIACELLDAFTGAHVLVHVVVGGHLELIARRLESGAACDLAPDWVKRVPLDGPLVMAVAAREKKVVSHPVSELPEPRRSALGEMGLHHLHVVPLLFHDAAFGTITLAHGRDIPWDPESIRLLDAAAVQLGVELAHVRLLEAERRRAEDLGLVNELGSLIAQHLELPAVLATAVQELARISQVERVHLFLADAARTVLSGAASSDPIEVGLTFPLTSSAAVVHAFHSLEPVVIEHAATDVRTNKELVAQKGLRSIMAVPLVSGGEAIGAIALVETRHPRVFTETEVARAVAVANLVSPALSNAKMFEELRRSYEALARTQAELVTHERLAALGELSAVIAHEVRNPLAIIFNSLGALRRLEPSASDANMLLDIVGEEAARLNRIVGDLLDFVRPYTSHPRHVQVATIVKGAVEAARRATPDTDVEVDTRLQLPSADLFLDGTMLQQALINLIVNAVQATPTGKRVAVTASIQTSEAHTQLCCEVVDEGPGIDAADNERVFQPFFTTKATGTGLGLALVRRIATALGGVIHVARAPSGGSLFTLTVPVNVAT